MPLPDPATLERIHAALEDRLIGMGFGRGVLAHLNSGRANLNSQIKRQPDSDWEHSTVFHENMQDLTTWAIRRLERLQVPRQEARMPSTPTMYGPTTTALAYLVAGDPELQAQVAQIRQTFLATDTAPFPARTLGIVDALRQAGEWLDEALREDRTAGARKDYIGLDLVLHGEDPSIDVRGAVRSMMFRFTQKQPDGTRRGSDMSVAEFFDALGELTDPSKIQVARRSLRGCGEDGEESPLLSLRGTDGWLKHWRVRHAGQMYELAKQCKALAKASMKWSESEALEYVMAGIVPSLGPQANWSGLGQVGATLTLTFRAPVTRDEVIEAYNQALSRNMFSPVKARRLSIRHQAVLQLVHDMPNATWGERLKRYEEWRKRHPELPAYRGSTAQQAIRTDYRRALERADWQDVTGTRGDTVCTP